VTIIYLHQYFVAPKSAGALATGTRSYEFARRFVAAGHEVHMVCSDWVTPQAGSPPPKTAKAWKREVIEGIQVHALPLRYSNKMSFVERVATFVRFALLARRKAAALKGDVVFATSTPLTIAIPAMHAARVNRVPLVFEVRDLWPEAPRQMGVLTNPVLFRAAKELERRVYRRSRTVVALSPGMRDGVLAEGVSPDRVVMIPNSCDLDMFRPDIDGSATRARLGLGDRMTFLYFGTMGPANGLDFVLDAAAELKRRGDVRAVFVLHGDGKMRPALEARKASEGLDNVVFSAPLADKSRVAEVVAAADVGMTIYKNLPVLYTCSPNKMFDTMAAGRAILTNMPGWLTDTVESGGCGVGVRPDDARDFADKVQRLAGDRAAVAEMGRRARALAEREFARDILAGRLLAVLERAVADEAGLRADPPAVSAVRAPSA
jgi:glycosyltransferase involved in cell wall biosynthesis